MTVHEQATSELSRLIECLAADHRSAGGFYPSPLLSLLGHKVIGAYPIEPLRQTCANVALLQQTSTVGGSAGHNNSGQTGAFYLRRTLINRIDSVSEQLSVATIQLMLALLNSGSPSIRKAFLPNDFATADEAAATDVTLPTLSQWFGLFAGDHATWPTAPRDAAPSTGAATAAAVAALHRRRAFAAYLQDAQVRSADASSFTSARTCMSCPLTVRTHSQCRQTFLCLKYHKQAHIQRFTTLNTNPAWRIRCT